MASKRRALQYFSVAYDADDGIITVSGCREWRWNPVLSTRFRGFVCSFGKRAILSLEDMSWSRISHTGALSSRLGQWSQDLYICAHLSVHDLYSCMVHTS